MLKFAKSPSDIYGDNFVKVKTPNGVDTVTITSNDIEKMNFMVKIIEPQKLFREISQPINDGEKHETHPGYSGLLINGVEILNYKSKNSVYYGS